jgi:glycosyltransferase involved in cell wall biosynthesis
LQGFESRPDTEIHVISVLRRAAVAPPKIGKNIFFHAVQVPRWGFLKSLYMPAIVRIRALLRQIRPKIVHGQGTERYYGLAAAYSGFPSMVTVHGNMRAVARAVKAREFSFHGITASLESIALRKADGVICLTNYAKREVEDLADLNWVIPNAVHGSFFEIAATPAPVSRVLCLGLVCPYKNQNDLIRLLAPIAREISFQLIFAGPISDGDYGNEFKALVHQHSWCVYLGALTREEVRAEIGRTTVLAHPSKEDNCPMVILEAMAAGVPAVGSAIGGIPDLIDDRISGYLCDVADMNQFARAIRMILGAPSLRAELSAGAKERAERLFRPASIARQHEGAYRELLNKTANR